MTGKVFIDTTALVSYFDGKDVYPGDVREKVAGIVTSGIQFVLTDYIFDEAITTVKSKMGHQISMMAGEFML